MSRREEVEANIANLKRLEAWGDNAATLTLILADEVDAERAKNAHWERIHGKAPKCAHLNCCAEAYAERAIVTKLLALYVPCKEREDDSITQRALNGIMTELHARACEIAGRKE